MIKVMETCKSFGVALDSRFQIPVVCSEFILFNTLSKGMQVTQMKLCLAILLLCSLLDPFKRVFEVVLYMWSIKIGFA
jgi:hypothetical protein